MTPSPPAASKEPGQASVDPDVTVSAGAASAEVSVGEEGIQLQADEQQLDVAPQASVIDGTLLP